MTEKATKKEISDEAPELGDLPNKPLVEAIFEFRWVVDELTSDSGSGGWSNLPFKFYGKIEKSYPEPIDLPTVQIPEPLAPHVIRHQFRRGAGQWPLIQLGSGILSVNQTTGYTVWKEFAPLIDQAMNALIESHVTEIKPLRVELRYINAVPVNLNEIGTGEFLDRFLHTSVKTPSDVFASHLQPDKSIATNAAWRFVLANPKGEARLMIANGLKDDRDHIIWHLAIRAERDDAPWGYDKLRQWLEDSHKVIDKWFMKLTAGELLESFKVPKQ